MAADWNVILPVAGLALVGYLLIQGEGAPNGGETLYPLGFSKYMSNRGPAFSASAVVKQTRALSGIVPNWIKASVPVTAVNDCYEAEAMGNAVRQFLVSSQAYELARYQKRGYRVILPNNRKVIFVKGD
jgi:hypothetical protein